MLFTAAINANTITNVSANITIVIIILYSFEYFAFFQTRGKTKGPIIKNPKNQGTFCINDKLSFFCGAGLAPFKNSEQCLHFIASSCISSAQKGHFFIIMLPL